MPVAQKSADAKFSRIYPRLESKDASYTKSVSRFTQILLDEGFISKPCYSNDVCLFEQLSNNELENFFRHGWESEVDSDSESDKSQISDVSDKTELHSNSSDRRGFFYF